MVYFITILRYLPVVEAVPYLILYYIASAVRMAKTKSSNDVSVLACTISFLIQAMYIPYGILIIGEWQYIMSCLIGFTGSAIVLLVAIYYRIKKKLEENKNE